MKKGFVPYLAIILLASALQTGCHPSTQVTNNTSSANGPWVMATSDSAFPLIIADSDGSTLSAIRDTASNKIIGCVYRDPQNVTTSIWSNDSALPEKAVIGNYEFFFANYTDTSVDVVVTDSAGDLGIATNMDIRGSLMQDSIHSNIVGRAFKKKGSSIASPVPYGETMLQIGKLIKQLFSTGACVWAGEVAAGEVLFIIGTGGLGTATLISVLGELAVLGKACQSAFEGAWPEIEKLLMQIGTSNPPPQPEVADTIKSAIPFQQANVLDQYIGNKSGIAYWTLSGAGEPCSAYPVLGGHFAPTGPNGDFYSASDTACYIVIYRDGSATALSHSSSCDGDVTAQGSLLRTDGKLFGRFSGSKAWYSGIPITLTGTFRVQ